MGRWGQRPLPQTKTARRDQPSPRPWPTGAGPTNDLPPLCDGHVVAPSGADVDLTRAVDAPLGIRGDLAPVGDPAGGTTDGEHDGEHVRRDAERAEDDARVEIDVWVKLARDEVVVLQRRLLEVVGDVEQRVGLAELFQHDAASLADDLG